MDVEVPRGAAAWNGAAVVVARKDLFAQSRCDRRRGALRCIGIKRAEDAGVARRALDDLWCDVDLAAGAVLRGASTVRALLKGDLVCRLDTT